MVKRIMPGKPFIKNPFGTDAKFWIKQVRKKEYSYVSSLLNMMNCCEYSLYLYLLTRRPYRRRRGETTRHDAFIPTQLKTFPFLILINGKVSRRAVLVEKFILMLNALSAISGWSIISPDTKEGRKEGKNGKKNNKLTAVNFIVYKC